MTSHWLQYASAALASRRARQEEQGETGLAPALTRGLQRVVTLASSVVVLALAGAPLAAAADPDWDSDPKAPPGMEDVFPQWVGWGKWVAIGCGILGLIACGVMMMVGRRNRSHLAAEGASGLLWVMAGLSVVSLAAGVVPAIIA